MPYFYGFDPLYMILVMPAILISLLAQIKVSTSFSKYSKVFAPLTGEEAARKVLEMNGVTNVKIERVSGNLSDHYNPKTNTIMLSETVFSASTIAAVGVAAHEAGHAVQYAKGYSPIKLRTVIYPISSIGSRLSIPLVIAGILFSFSALVYVGIIFFIAALIFQLVTLPVEFNASRRAIETLRNGNVLTNEADLKGAKKVLTAAAMTYVAAVIVSLAQLIRLLSLANNRRN